MKNSNRFTFLLILCSIFLFIRCTKEENEQQLQETEPTTLIDTESVTNSQNDEAPPKMSAKTFVPDDAFEEYLIFQGYDDVVDDYVLTENISAVKEIFVFGQDYAIRDLTGLQDFKSLERLILENGPLTDIDVSEYKNLVELSLTRMVNLEELSIAGTCLESLSLSKLSLNKLEITKNHALVRFFTVDSRFTDFIFDSNPKIEFLDLEDTFTESFKITNNKTLRQYFCNSCGHTEINFTNNENFESYGVDIDDRLSIEYLTFNNNPRLNQINVSSLTKLIKLNANNNGLTMMDISQNTQLVEFDIAGNPLTCIQVNEAQLNAIPEVWSKDPEDVYCLDCP